MASHPPAQSPLPDYPSVPGIQASLPPTPSPEISAASPSSPTACDPLFYAKYSLSLPSSLLSSPRPAGRSIPRPLPCKRDGWEEMRIRGVAPGREERRQPSVASMSEKSDGKRTGEEGETCASPKTATQDICGLFTRSRSLYSSFKTFHTMGEQPLQSFGGAEHYFRGVSVDLKEHGKTTKELWRLGVSEFLRGKTFGRYSESSLTEERLPAFCAGSDIGSKSIKTRKVSGAAIRTTSRGSRSDRSWESVKGPVSPHELHYTRHRANAEQKRRETFITYRPSLLGCAGFTSKSYRCAVGMQSLHVST